MSDILSDEACCTLSGDARSDLLARGYSRRHFGRISTLLGMGAAAAPLLARAAPSAGPKAAFVGHPDMVRIGSNECWTGPFPDAAQAGIAVIPQGNRYEPSDLRQTLLFNASQVEGVPVDHIQPWAGSSDPLCRSIVSFAGPGRGVVTANPTYEAAWMVAKWLNVKLTRVPLRARDQATDVRGMLAADPHAGVYYVCSPNNPTGTITPVEDIEWLVDNKPKGSIVVVDEAYLHFAGTPSAIPMVKAGKDVIVLRTFSKLFGMAGLRLGLCFARPDILSKMLRYDGNYLSYMLPVTSEAIGAHSLLMADAIVQRRNEMIAARDFTCAHLKKRGIPFIPSQANMIMVQWSKPAAEVKAAFAAQKVEIGRSWEIWPNRSRITIGSMANMQAFCTALDKVMA
ncbi:pyridoxal phosphate-dependent aminotransferase [Tanticharoenia sakaeratensis]|uniref:Aminotransferase n=1 Tax=Tanticharoenia sakaeratensis NBRC 103193 TaxID=1231623 RepID=A0A0D6MM12_9PROT|nr:pyridoxal phosphate-dependent aminotransferase [Tanticharoenia sakaeratensis]GAN54717.1 aminotransferase [Tanticharoenia sakaeratensis NBRC 103193]GBQ16898.1 aminotransferase [Tanticharoenia sakaeratensis NBRC 103193]